MSIHKKRFSVGWALGIFLGIVCGGALVYAGSIATTYKNGDTLQAADLNAIVGALNQVQGNAGNGACVTNNSSDEMVRVGPICVDKYPASLWSDASGTATDVTAIPGGCAPEGTGCSGIVAQSRATPGTLKNATAITYAQALVSCANAGKRLLTPGEWMTASAVGTATGMATTDSLEFVDGFTSATGTTVAQASYMGPTTAAGGKLQFVSNVAYNATNVAWSWLGFRCAR